LGKSVIAVLQKKWFVFLDSRGHFAFGKILVAGQSQACQQNEQNKNTTGFGHNQLICPANVTCPNRLAAGQLIKLLKYSPGFQAPHYGSALPLLLRHAGWI
jgi:hypothetical protein